MGREADGAYYERDILHYRYIGIEPSLFHRYEDRFIRVDADKQIEPGIFLLTPTNITESVPARNLRLVREVNDHFEPDPSPMNSCW